MSYDGLKMINVGTLPIFASELVLGLVGAMSDVVLILDRDGTIVAASNSEVRSSLASFGRHVGESIHATLDASGSEKLRARLQELDDRVRDRQRGSPIWCEVMHNLSDGSSVPLRHSIHWIDTEERYLLLGRDQRPMMELQQQLVSAQIALERDYEAQREMDTRYRILMETTRDPILFVSVSTRRIVDINTAAAELLGGSRQALSGIDVAHEFEGRTPAEFIDAVTAVATSEVPYPIEVQARRSQKRLMLTPRLFRAAGERLVLCRLEGTGRSQPADADPLAENLRSLYAEGVDGIVFTDRDGLILAASEAFLNLTDTATQAEVKGRSLADFLSRGMVDLKVMLENARRAGHLRLYPTRLKTDFDGEIAVEISATWIKGGGQPVMALVVRDASRSEALRAPVAGPEAGMGNVMELVGSSSLKDIVAETTNVIEKLCIETAVELTRNNRVAAAEMLGLSRQSLYVKLRKYGLLNREDE